MKKTHTHKCNDIWWSCSECKCPSHLQVCVQVLKPAGQAKSILPNYVDIWFLPILAKMWRKLSLWMFSVWEDFWSSLCPCLKARELQVSHLCPTLGFRIPHSSSDLTHSHHKQTLGLHAPPREAGLLPQIEQVSRLWKSLLCIPCPSYSLVHNMFPSPPGFTYSLSKHLLSISTDHEYSKTWVYRISWPRRRQ